MTWDDSSRHSAGDGIGVPAGSSARCPVQEKAVGLLVRLGLLARVHFGGVHVGQRTHVVELEVMGVRAPLVALVGAGIEPKRHGRVRRRRGRVKVEEGSFRLARRAERIRVRELVGRDGAGEADLVLRWAWLDADGGVCLVAVLAVARGVEDGCSLGIPEVLSYRVGRKSLEEGVDAAMRTVAHHNAAIVVVLLGQVGDVGRHGERDPRLGGCLPCIRGSRDDRLPYEYRRLSWGASTSVCVWRQQETPRRVVEAGCRWLDI